MSERSIIDLSTDAGCRRSADAVMESPDESLPPPIMIMGTTRLAKSGNDGEVHLAYVSPSWL